MDYSRFFEPESIAVIGASADPAKLGHNVVANLIKAGYPHSIYPINPNAPEILGYRAYPSVLDVPDNVDLAIIVLPAALVENQLEACGQKGVPAVIVTSGGFREVGGEGTAREKRLQEIAQQYQIALLGPNCIGTMDTGALLNTTFLKDYPLAGSIALLTQSGATAAVIIDWANREGVGFSRIVSLGNQAGVTEADMLEALCSAQTRVIAAYLEGIADGQEFVEKALRVSPHTPIVALKVGRGKQGAQAAASHTGALAGSEAAYDAAFRRSGVLRADTLQELLEWSRALAWQPLPKGNRAAVITNAGGPGVMAVDALEAAGMQIAPLTENTRATLRQQLPPAASVANPIDILAGSGVDMYAHTLDAALADETVDAVVVMTAPQDWFPYASLCEIIGSRSNPDKPIFAVVMGMRHGDPGLAVLQHYQIPNFEFPENVGRTLAGMWQRSQWLAQPKIELSEPQRIIFSLDHYPAGWLEADTIQQLMDIYQIPTPGSQVVSSLEEALEFAEYAGYPVVLKLANVLHKTEAGGVRLNLKNPAELEAAYRAMTAHHSGGVLVQQMITGGVELIVGLLRDPNFGTLVMTGSGGTQVELYGDVDFEIAPLSEFEANRLLDRTAAGRLVDGFRGQPAGDRAAVMKLLQAVGEIGRSYPRIAEMDINPLMVRPDGVYAVDVRIRLT